MKPRILLVNPPIYDFSAYDFWLKPYGLLRVAGFLRAQADFCLFDYLDRFDPRVPPGRYRSDPWGRGEFYSQRVEKPQIFGEIRRQFRRRSAAFQPAEKKTRRAKNFEIFSALRSRSTSPSSKPA